MPFVRNHFQVVSRVVIPYSCSGRLKFVSSNVVFVSVIEKHCCQGAELVIDRLRRVFLDATLLEKMLTRKSDVDTSLDLFINAKSRHNVTQKWWYWTDLLGSKIARST